MNMEQQKMGSFYSFSRPLAESRGASFMRGSERNNPFALPQQTPTENQDSQQFEEQAFFN
jgi:hypothetical protein